MTQPSKLLIGALVLVLALAFLPVGPLSGNQNPFFNLLSAVGSLTIPSGGSGACVASNGTLTQDIGGFFAGVKNLNRGDCVSLAERHSAAIIDTFCTNSVSLNKIDISWAGRLIRNLDLSCPSGLIDYEAPATIQGELVVSIEEDFDAKRYQYVYEVLDDVSKKLVRVEFKSKIKEESFLSDFVTGRIVKVRGLAKPRPGIRSAAHGSDFYLEAENQTSESIQFLSDESTSSAAPTTERPIITVLINFIDRPVGKTKEQVDSVLFSPTNSTSDIYSDSSFGTIGLKRDTNGDGQPDIYGPVTIDYYSSDPCLYGEWANDAVAKLKAQGVSFDGYLHWLFIIPENSNCSWGGIANLGLTNAGYSRAWVKNYVTSYPMLANHELGHNLGMSHASDDLNNDGAKENEYSNEAYMGYPYGGLKTDNAPHKHQLGWIPSSAAPLITTSGTYTVAATQVRPGTSSYPNTVRVNANTSNYYYISYRAPIGYDSTLGANYLNKLSIHRFSSSLTGNTLLVGLLSPGQTFTDPVNNIAITYLGNSSTTATFDLSLTGTTSCLESKPLIVITPVRSYVGPGGQATHTVSVTNNDSSACGSSQFNLSVTDLSNAVETLLPVSLTINPQSTATASLVINAGQAMTTGDYLLTLTVRDSQGKTVHNNSAQFTMTVDASPPSAPANLTAAYAKGNKVSLKWSSSTDNSLGSISYRIYRNGAEIATVIGGTSYTDAPNTSITNSYYVVAVDVAGNLSQPSNIATLEPQVKGGGPKK